MATARARVSGIFSGTAMRLTATLVVLALVLAGAYYYFIGSGKTRSAVGEFSSAVGMYKGTPVKIRGVQVGEITGVHPDGTVVDVSFNYDSKYKVPKDAKLVAVANSLVSDRYLQLAWADDDHGARMPNGFHIQNKDTNSPAELDDIYSALAKLTTALGPNGANKDGSLSTLLQVAAADLKGNGAPLAASIHNLSAAASTLANHSTDLFSTVTNLKNFTQTLANSDSQVRKFEDLLTDVAGDLAAERDDLGSALHNLQIALHQVAQFVKGNAGRFHTSVEGLKTVTNVLVKEQSSLREVLAVGPVTLANLVHAYEETTGTIGARTNITTLLDPAQICNALDGLGLFTSGSGNPLLGVLGKLLGTVQTTCQGVLKKVGLGGTGVPTNASGTGTTTGGSTTGLPVLPGVPGLSGSGTSAYLPGVGQ